LGDYDLHFPRELEPFGMQPVIPTLKGLSELVSSIVEQFAALFGR